MKRSRGLQTLLSLAAIAAIVALLLYVAQPGGDTAENPLSATSTTPLGMNAFYQLLKSERMQPAFFGYEPEMAPYGSALFVGDDIPYSGWQRYLDRDRLWEAAAARALNVVYLPPLQDHAFEPPGGAAPAEPGTVARAEGGELEPPPLPAGVEVREIAWELGRDGYTRIFPDGVKTGALRGIRLLEAGGFSPAMVPPLGENEKILQAARVVYLFEGTDRPFLVAAKVGRGTWTMVSASELFTNRDIGRADNVVLAYNLAADARGAGGPVYFLESIHGYSVSDTGVLNLLFFTWWGQLALFGLLGAVVIYLPSMFPLGREVVTPVVKFPSALLRVQALAEMWRKSPDRVAVRRFALATALGIEPDAGGARRAAGMLQEVGYPQSRARQLAEELVSGEVPTMSAEAIRAYGRLVQRFGRISRFN